MEPPHDRTLWRYLAGALDPGDATEVEARVAADRAWRDALDQVRQRLGDADLADRWSVPRLALSGRPPVPRFEIQAQAALAGDPLRPGDRVVLRVADPPGRPPRLLLVREAGGLTEVVHPLGPDDWPRLDEFPLSGGLREIDLVLGGPEGEHRYVLALLPDDLAVDWSRAATERWAAAREGVEDGRIAAVVGTVVVGAPPRG